jgi:hypothetical protein
MATEKQILDNINKVLSTFPGLLDAMRLEIEAKIDGIASKQVEILAQIVANASAQGIKMDSILAEIKKLTPIIPPVVVPPVTPPVGTFDDSIYRQLSGGKAYYVDSVDGNDNNNGLSFTNPFKTLNKATSRILNPGEAIFIKKGSIFKESLSINSSGNATNPIYVQAYGDGNLPIIDKSDNSNNTGVYLYGSYINLLDLDIRNCSYEGIFAKNSQYNNIVNCNFSKVGCAIELGNFSKVLGCSFADLILILNSDGTDSGWGALPILLEGVNDIEVAFCNFVNCIASSSIYSFDGGVVEFYKSVINAKIHNNKANNCCGFSEFTGIAKGIEIYNNEFVSTDKINQPFLGFHLDDGCVYEVNAHNNKVLNPAKTGGIGNSGVISFWGVNYSQDNKINLDNNEFETFTKIMDASQNFPFEHSGNKFTLNPGASLGAVVANATEIVINK